ncbi:hypothetical protein ACJ41O_005571 [Fusarium nematophilum]
MAPLNDETQTQLLELIQGIKGAQERQNILLEKLVEVIAASADDSGQKEDANREVNDTAEETHSTNRESKNTNEAKDSGEEVIVEKPETSPASDGPINEHDREVEERFGSLPDEFKKRIKIYTGSDDHERLLLEVLCGTVKALDGYQRNPADGTELGCTTNDWKYYTSGIISSLGRIWRSLDSPGRLKSSWCRVVHIQGLANALAGLVEGDCNASTAMDVWRLLIYDDDRPLGHSERPVVRQMFNQHLFCQRYTKPSTQEGGLPWRAFHVAWYELCREPTREQLRQSTWKYGRLYGDDGRHIRQQALTVGCFYIDNASDPQRPPLDETVWTMLVLSPDSQRLRSDSPCRSNIFMLGYIYDGLRQAADAWDAIRSSLTSVTDTEPPILDPRQHDDLLFDDDTFSRSRQYFWVVNSLESFKTLIDDAVEEWTRLQGCWPSILQGAEEGEISQEAQELLAGVEAQVARLRELSARFAFTHEKTKALREGLFSASGVIESRVSTRLGENVRLLTYVSIFYLPLSFCVALWSTNENYARPMLVLASFLVAAVTFLFVANLRNLTAIGTSLYRRLKRAIVRRMRDSEDEAWVKRAKAFEGYRPEREEVEPSEWRLVQFLFSRMISCLAFWKMGRSSGKTRVNSKV